MAEIADDLCALSGRSLVEVVDKFCGKVWWRAFSLSEAISLIPHGITSEASWSADLAASAQFATEELRPLICALRVAAVHVAGIGDATMDFKPLVVAPGFWKIGRWVLTRRPERLVAIGDDWSQVGTVYSNPQLIVRGPRETSAPESPRVTEIVPGNRLPYGSASSAVRAALADHAEALATMPHQKERARFLAEKVGCSESLVKQILRSEGK
jgi:hypothetical protein